MNRTTKHSPDFIYGFLTGGIIFGGLALLFAPKKGSKLRKDISKVNGELINSAGNYLNSVVDKADELISEGKDKLNSLMDSAEDAMKSTLPKDLQKEIKDTAANYVSLANDKAEHLISKSKDKISHLMDSDSHNKTSHKKHNKH